MDNEKGTLLKDYSPKVLVYVTIGSKEDKCDAVQSAPTNAMPQCQVQSPDARVVS